MLFFPELPHKDSKQLDKLLEVLYLTTNNQEKEIKNKGGNTKCSGLGHGS